MSCLALNLISWFRSLERGTLGLGYLVDVYICFFFLNIQYTQFSTNNSSTAAASSPTVLDHPVVLLRGTAPDEQSARRSCRPESTPSDDGKLVCAKERWRGHTGRACAREESLCKDAPTPLAGPSRNRKAVPHHANLTPESYLRFNFSTYGNIQEPVTNYHSRAPNYKTYDISSHKKSQSPRVKATGHGVP
ncbi:hypothetical protein K440DRAFT_636396 [Wilcoxina mikolae CBS 423.85]|nr:hypothetical protein K440DRAFT_636396 [Wilcoxina mikolae CBS 423.85]